MSSGRKKHLPKKVREKISKALLGPKNPAWKDGRRAYRRIAGAKPGEGVHHKSGDSTDNRPSNLVTYKLKGPGRAKHEKIHQREKNFKSSGGRKKLPRGYKAKRLKR